MSGVHAELTAVHAVASGRRCSRVGHLAQRRYGSGDTRAAMYLNAAPADAVEMAGEIPTMSGLLVR